VIQTRANNGGSCHYCCCIFINLHTSFWNCRTCPTYHNLAKCVNYRTDLHEPQVGGKQFDHLQVLINQIVLFSVIQLLLAMAASLGYMTGGLVRGFSSPGVPSMQQLSPHLVPDERAFSWISKYVICTSYNFNPSRYEKEGVLTVCLNIQHKLWMLKSHSSVEFRFI